MRNLAQYRAHSVFPQFCLWVPNPTRSRPTELDPRKTYAKSDYSLLEMDESNPIHYRSKRVWPRIYPNPIREENPQPPTRERFASFHQEQTVSHRRSPRSQLPA